MDWAPQTVLNCIIVFRNKTDRENKVHCRSSNHFMKRYGNYFDIIFNKYFNTSWSSIWLGEAKLCSCSYTVYHTRHLHTGPICVAKIQIFCIQWSVTILPLKEIVCFKVSTWIVPNFDHARIRLVFFKFFWFLPRTFNEKFTMAPNFFFLSKQLLLSIFHWINDILFSIEIAIKSLKWI